MSRVLLAGIAAALLLTTGAAHAEVRLPATDPLIGGWCSTKTENVYKRGACDELFMTRSGSGGVDTSCTFTEIKKIPNGIEAIEFCTLGDNGVVWVEKSTYQIIGRRLRIKQIFTSEKAKNETGCVTVGPTPDGFLNLRVGPGMMFTVKAKLNMGDLLRIDAKNDEWTHVTGVVEDSWVKTDAWVYTKYVKEGASCDFP